MKKILYILPLALATLVSCQKEESFISGDNAVTINATIDKNIPLGRANTTDDVATSWENGDQIAINNEGNAYVTYTFNGTSWATAPGEFLKWSTETMTFNGYHPVTEGTSLTDFTLPTDQSDLAKISAADYMTVTNVSKTKPESGYGVDLNFSRKTARVIVKITKMNNEFVGTPVISNLTITSKYSSYASGVGQGEPTAVTAYKVADKDSYIALVVPYNATSDADFINLDVTDDTGTKSLKVSTIHQTEAGKSYTHNLTVGKNKIEVNTVTVEDWGQTGTLPDGDVDVQAGSVAINNTDGLIILNLTDYRYENITSLSISGSLNYHDFGVIRLNLHNLEILDLSQTTITGVPEHALNYFTGEGAVGNLKLKKIILPRTVKTIGSWAFQYCKALTSISLDGVETIGEKAFNSCSALSSVDLGDNLTTVNNAVFINCTSLRSVEFPASIRTLGKWMFENCSSLKTIKLNQGIATIPQSAFYDCRALESINIPASVKTLNGWMFENCTNLKTITLPEGIDDIPASAFYGAMGLTSINIPASVTSIGNYAFAGCLNLESITIPKTVKSLGTYMFDACHFLISPVVLADVTELPAGMFNNCLGLTTCTLNDKIQIIGEQAFATCQKLSSINMPANLVSIGVNAFSNTALTTVTLPAGVASIGEAAFYNSTINTLTINSTVDLTIGHRAFFSCDKTMKITLPATLKSISCTAFDGNDVLQITCHAVVPPQIVTGDPNISPNPTYWTPYTGCYLKVPAGSVNAYKAIYFWGRSFQGENLTTIE